ncbi:MAG: TPM domain-containing protein, partial [Lachnospiraceae bacterium]|nr:TPM domain-containing protein [Lachnospiraceae bacterium]
MMKKNIQANAIKVLLTIVLLVAGIMMIPVTALAYDPLDEDTPDFDKKNPDTGYRVIIYDGADLLSESEMKQLAEDMSGITQWGDVAFVSTDQNNYNDIMRYSEALFYQLFDDDDNAIMLIIDMDVREISIFSDGSIHRVITDAYGYDITDNIYRYATNREYYRCASKGFEQIYTVLNGQKIARPMKYICSILMGLLVSLLVNFIIINKASKIQNTGSAEMLSGAYKSLRFTTPRVIKTGESRT